MRRFLCPELSELQSGALVALSEVESRHAIRVLRLKPGDSMQLLDGSGRIGAGVLEGLDGKTVTVQVVSISRSPARPVEITVFQALIKSKGMDTAIQKLAEMGICRIVPIRTRHGEVRLSDADAKGKVDKWRQSAIETLKQCGYPWAPDIAPVTSVRESLLEYSPELDAGFVSALDPQASRVRLDQKWDRNPPVPLKLGLWTGPEGDWSSEELKLLNQGQVESIHLGPSVLRSETASIVGATQLFHEAARLLGDAS